MALTVVVLKASIKCCFTQRLQLKSVGYELLCMALRVVVLKASINFLLHAMNKA